MIIHGPVIYLLLHFLVQIRILFIYGWPNVNKPYLEKYGDERVNLVSSDGSRILLSQQPKG